MPSLQRRARFHLNVMKSEQSKGGDMGNRKVPNRKSKMYSEVEQIVNEKEAPVDTTGSGYPRSHQMWGVHTRVKPSGVTIYVHGESDTRPRWA
jgi:hypothetical protein